MSKLYLVGIGPGSKEYLTFKAIETIKSSDVVMGSQRALDLFRDLKAETIELNVQNMNKMFKHAISMVSHGKYVSILSTGDPGFSGVLNPVQKLSGDIEIEVVPGVSSVQICAAKLQIPWDKANIVTLHGKGISKQILNMIENGNPTIILPNRTVNELSRFFLDNGVAPTRKVAVCEKMSYFDERIIRSTLEEVEKEKFSYMCVFVVY